MSDDSHEYDEDALEFIEDERVRIAALHATCPKQIWLQVDPEAEQFDGWDAQTWCSDKINETDVRYVLASSRDAEVAELKGANVLNRNALRLQKEKADQLREQVKMLRDALTRIRDRPLVNDVVHKIAVEALAAGAATPEQSLARLRNQVREECAAILDDTDAELYDSEFLAATIRAMKEPE